MQGVCKLLNTHVQVIQPFSIDMVDERPSGGDKRELVSWLVGQISYHSDLYYNQAAPIISDAEFDLLWSELKN